MGIYNFKVAYLNKVAKFLVLVSVLLISACQSELYTELEEREVSEMISVLAANGISSTRTDDGKGKYGISVDRQNFSSAISILSEKGLPRQNFGSLGKIFNSDKLVSTPFEERARFMHALNEELANSITRINGVVSARVHIMVPETSQLNKTETQPRASVFIYQEAGVNLENQVPVIKNLIVNSVDNLEYSFVEVALFADSSAITSRMNAEHEFTSGIWSLLTLLGAGILILLGWVWFTSGSSAKKTRAINHVVEGKTQ